MMGQTPSIRNHTSNITTSLVREEKCYQTMVIIPLPMYSNTSDHLWNVSNPEMAMSYPNDGFFDFLNIADVLFWGLVCMVIAGGTWLYRKLPHCAARGKAIDVERVDDENENSDKKNHTHPKDTGTPSWNDNDDHFSISSGMVDDHNEAYFNNEIWYHHHHHHAIAPSSDLVGSNIFDNA